VLLPGNKVHATVPLRVHFDLLFAVLRYHLAECLVADVADLLLRDPALSQAVSHGLLPVPALKIGDLLGPKLHVRVVILTETVLH
jgi:hypothetical protein